MNRVLIVAEHADGKLNAAVAKCVACASTIPDAEISVAVLAAEGTDVAAAAAAIQGVSRVLLVKNPANEPALAAVLAPQVAKLSDGAAFVLGPSTTFGKDLMPRVAALLGAPQLSDVMAVESATRFRRPVYAANAIATVEIPAGRQVVATVRVASYQAARRRRPCARRDGGRGCRTARDDAVRVGVRGAQRPARPADRHAGRLGRPRARQRRELQGDPIARGQARRRHRRLARGRRRGLRLRTNCRSARPARSSRPSSISRSASAAPSST